MDEEYQEFLREELTQIMDSDGYASDEERVVIKKILNDFNIPIL